MIKVEDTKAVAFSEIHELMEEILRQDSSPAIFRVYIEATDHTDGFTARCTFRDNNPQMTQWTNRGDTPEEALRGLYETVNRTFGPCPHCGRKGTI